MIKYQRNIIIIVSIILLFASCRTNKISSKTTKEKELNFKYYFAEAGRNRMLGNYDIAINNYLTCIKLNPKSGASNYFISLMLYNRKDYQSAEAFAQQATKIRNEELWYSVNYAIILTKEKKYDDAIAEYERILKIHPEQKLVYYSISDIQLNRNNLNGAISVFEQIIDKFGFEEELAITLYDLYLSVRNSEKAYRILNQLVKAFPEKLKYKAMLAEYYVTVNELDKAKTLYEDLMKQDNENISVRLSYASYCKFVNNKKCFYENSEVIAKSSDIELDTKLKVILSGYKNQYTDEQYETLLNILVEKYPDNKIVHAIYSEFLLSKGDKQDALQNLRQAIEIDNSDFQMVVALMELELELADFENMYKDSKKLLTVYPNQPQIFLYNGISAYQLDNYKQTINSLEQGKDLVIDDKKITEQFYIYLAESYSELANYKKSDAYYDLLITNYSENLYSANNYAYSLAEQNKNLDKAEKIILNCVKLQPKSSMFISTYAWVLFKKKNYAKAYSEMQKAFNLEKENYEIAEQLGDILFMQNKVNEAVTYWKKAQKLGANSEELNLKIEQKKIEINE